MKPLIKKILLNNTRDLGEFFGMTVAFDEIFSDFFQQLVLAIAIIIINTVIIPLIRFGLKKLKEKTPDAVDKIIDEFEEKLVDKMSEKANELTEQEKKAKEKPPEDKPKV